MQLLALFSLLASLASTSALSPHARSYDTHQYYALELSTDSTAAHVSSVAVSLGVELLEQIGELDGHWLVRVPGSTPLSNSTIVAQHDDPIVKRWRGLRKRSKRDGAPSSLRSLTPLHLRRRAKRDSSHIPRRSHPLSLRDDTELLYAQTDLGIADPMLNQQWHLINTEMADVELNVTGLWAKGITGTGVKVALIDDGLDFNSDDLKDNFVRRPSMECEDGWKAVLTTVSRRIIRLQRPYRTAGTAVIGRPARHKMRG